MYQALRTQPTSIQQNIFILESGRSLISKYDYQLSLRITRITSWTGNQTLQLQTVLYVSIKTGGLHTAWYFIYITFIIASFVEVLTTNPSYVFLPEGCEGIIHGIGFLLESLFFWCLQHDSNKDNNYQYIILIIVTLTCTVLSWVNVTCHTCQQFDTSLVTRYCLCMAMYLQSSWIAHCGINFLFQVRLPCKCKQNLYSVLYVKCFHICRQMVLVWTRWWQ